MTNNERFNRMLNDCKHPRAVLAALVALVPVIKAARENGQQADSMKGGVQDE